MITNVFLDPSNNDTLEGAFRHILENMKLDLSGALPAKVIAYDRTQNKATVQPLIRLVLTDGSSLSRPQIDNIPVMVFGGGGFLVSFPLPPGSLGWILANDRDISNFIQSYEESTPNTFRKKDFADSVFIPDIMTGYTISGGDSNNMTIQNLSGDVKISLGSNTITIDATNININGIVNITGSLFVNGNPIG